MPRTLIAALIALALVLAPAAAPPWPGLGAAHADDDGDDGDDGDDAPAAAPAGDGGSGRAPFARGAPARAPTARAAPRPAPPPPLARGEVVVIGLAPAARAAAEARGYRVVEARTLALIGAESLRLAPPPGVPAAAALAEIAALDPAATADLNHLYRTQTAAPEPCEGPHCPPRALIGWPAVDAACDPGGLIGMIDTGVNAAHAAFAPGRVEVLRLDPADRGPASGAGHGTAVAAILAGEAGGRTPGLLPAARVIAVDAFHRAGGEDRADAFTLATALNLLALRRVAAVNLSLAGPDNAVLARMVAAVAAQGTVLVAAVGNAGPGAAAAYPAAYPAVLAVTAVDARGAVWRRAQRGAHLDLAAPGVEIWTAASVSGGRPRTGTSFAAPFVTAAAYLLRMRGLDPAGIRAALAAAVRDLGPPGRDPVYGYGLIDARGLCAGPAGGG